MNIIVQATAMAYIVSGENVVMREYSIKFILILKMEKNKQIHCIGILYSQTFLEGHYEIVIYSNVNTKSLMLFILFKVRRLALENRSALHIQAYKQIHSHAHILHTHICTYTFTLFTFCNTYY